jgi:hypothetical protein
VNRVGFPDGFSLHPSDIHRRVQHPDDAEVVAEEEVLDAFFEIFK